MDEDDQSMGSSSDVRDWGRGGRAGKKRTHTPSPPLSGEMCKILQKEQETLKRGMINAQQ